MPVLTLNIHYPYVMLPACALTHARDTDYNFWLDLNKMYLFPALFTHMLHYLTPIVIKEPRNVWRLDVFFFSFALGLMGIFFSNKYIEIYINICIGVCCNITDATTFWTTGITVS